MSNFRWGIIGLGNISNKFAAGIAAAPGAELAAVASRTMDKANIFGDKYGVAKRYASYEELANDPNLDAVYIGTTHNRHKEDSLLCIRAGRAVLCEKPFTINAKEAQEVIHAARQKNVFVMEAMWTRFFPVMVRIRELIAQGAIGEPRMIQADFGFRAGVDPKGRLFNPETGGGGLLDVGIYPLSFASMVFGAPVETTGLAVLGETGVDEQAGMVLRYAEGRIAVLSTAIRTNTLHEAVVLGTEGHIRIRDPWWMPTTFTLSRNGKPAEEITLPYEGNGYNYQAVEVMNCVRAGQKESKVMPLDETLSLMKTMDSLRSQWGLKYPME